MHVSTIVDICFNSQLVLGFLGCTCTWAAADATVFHLSLVLVAQALLLPGQALHRDRVPAVVWRASDHDDRGTDRSTAQWRGRERQRSQRIM